MKHRLTRMGYELHGDFAVGQPAAARLSGDIRQYPAISDHRIFSHRGTEAQRVPGAGFRVWCPRLGYS